MKINLFVESCIVCKGKGCLGEDPAYGRYINAIKRGDCPIHIPSQFLYCKVCNGTGKMQTNLGFIYSDIKKLIEKILKKIGEKIKL